MCVQALSDRAEALTTPSSRCSSIEGLNAGASERRAVSMGGQSVRDATGRATR